MLESVEQVTHTTFTLDYLPLGNNFTYQHFIDAMAHEAQTIVEVYEQIDLDDNITIVANGIFGQVQLVTCGSDLHDHLYPLYNDIEFDDAYFYETYTPEFMHYD